ncbi:hypothetical protein Patl1_03883 [Pistacia atlantica]|uniref:Uncharacterized protein n=1 Tax=Pistacia atlantica TaxID=434234 RepID=A0ACC1BRQ9_9ROSI|nr:hypothetical protein Patl1_03883 [Pistacia atlantica]
MSNGSVRSKGNPLVVKHQNVIFARPSTLANNSELVNLRKLPKCGQQAALEQVSVATKDDKSLNSYKTGSVDSLGDKLDSGLSLGDPKQVPTYVGPEVSETKGSLEGGVKQEKKTSEHGVGTVSAKVSDGTGSLAKTSGSAKTSDRADFVESGKSSICRGSTSSDVSDESTCSSLSSSVNKPHKANDVRWEAIQAVRSKDGVLGVGHFKLLKKLGCGDIGSVYLSELSGTKCHFAMKVMDKTSLAKRKKLLRAQTEREILQSLDHPFLPSLYTHFETDKFSCLVMEFCPGAKDLIRGLLVKEPLHRLAYKRGATEIKQHPFFQGVNWALIRCASPPEIPRPVEIEKIQAPALPPTDKATKATTATAISDQNKYLEFDFF